MKNEKKKPSMSKRAAESKHKTKNTSYKLVPLEIFYLNFTNKTEIFDASTEFKSINKARAVFLKLGINT